MHLSPIPPTRLDSPGHSSQTGLSSQTDNQTSQRSLSWLNLLVAQMQTAFGGFLAVYLTAHAWNRTDLGLALSIGTATVMLCQIPAGALVDLIPSKRLAAGLAIAAIALCTLVIGIRPSLWSVLSAEALHGAASCVLTPAIAAITLTLARPDRLGERLGRNVQYAAIGSGIAAAAMGMVGYYLSHRFIFFLGAACGLAALIALRAIRTNAAPPPPQVRTRTIDRPSPPPGKAMPGRPLLIFATCMGLFQLGNAAILPIAANAVALAHGRSADLVIAAAIFLPQILAATFSPRFGRLTETWGRRPILLLGLIALPVRAILCAANSSPTAVIAFQALDGLSAAILGLMVPLVVADLTRATGRFNLAMGIVGLAIGIGATLSTLLAGWIADIYGDQMAFVALAAMGAAAVILAAAKFRETGTQVFFFEKNQQKTLSDWSPAKPMLVRT